MKTRLLYIVILICSIAFFSCAGQSKDSDSIIPVEDSVNADENFKAALREQLSEINGENERAEQHYKELQEEEEKEKKEYERILNALQGTWKWNHSAIVINNDLLGDFEDGVLQGKWYFNIDRESKKIRMVGQDIYFEYDLDNNGNLTLYGDRSRGIVFTKTSSSMNQSSQNPAPYGYNKYGEPYVSKDAKNLDKALDEFEKARQGYINATQSRNPMDLMFYHQRMKQEIENCLYYAKGLGDREIINKLKGYERWVDNLKY